MDEQIKLMLLSLLRFPWAFVAIVVFIGTVGELLGGPIQGIIIGLILGVIIVYYAGILIKME